MKLQNFNNVFSNIIPNHEINKKLACYLSDSLAIILKLYYLLLSSVFDSNVIITFTGSK